MCDEPHMVDDKLEQVRDAIRRAMARKKIKAKPLSLAAGLGETAVRDILEARSGSPRVDTLRRIAEQLDATIEDLIGSTPVRVTGRIGAGGSIIFDESDGAEIVPHLAGLPAGVEAFEVIGSSMLPRYSPGDVVYVSREFDGAKPSYYGEFCAVRLSSGETFIKQLARGSRPGFFNLRSLNAEDIEDVEIEWATPVLASLSRTARQLMGY